jgi:hypothetical protein
MSRKRTKPRNTTTVCTYASLDQWARAFADGHFNLLFILGNPGLQKSQLMRQTVAPPALWLQGHVTSFEMYRELYRHKDELVVIDDVDCLCAERESVRLLRDLCDSQVVKTVAWHSATGKLEEEGIPPSFSTASKVCIIGNAWKTLNPSVAALEDRGHAVLFDPSAEEVHHRTADWFTDRDIYDFIGASLHLISRPSMRHYTLARELKQAGMAWRDKLLEAWLPSWRTFLVAQLLADPSFASEEERVMAFAARSGGSKSTYYRHVALLRPPPDVQLLSLATPPKLASQLA